MTASIVFVLTEDCQLRCKYCYVVGKNNLKKNNLTLLRSALDILFKDSEFMQMDSVIFSFIGGEPLMEINLLAQTSEYITLKVLNNSPSWKDNYKFQITTNGILYDNAAVQQYIKNYHDKLSISISIDGTKEKNEQTRLSINGKSMHDKILNNTKLWVSQFERTTTRMVVSHSDLPYIAQSIMYLLHLNISFIDINLVVEEHWEEDDDKRLEQQLILVADEILKEDDSCGKRINLFDYNRQTRVFIDKEANKCGDYTITVGTDGRFYSCLRFIDYSLTKNLPPYIGDIHSGLDNNKRRALLSMDYKSVFSKECIECESARFCKWCTAVNYDLSKTGTIFYHPTMVCKMHKACVRANNYFYRKLSNKQK